MTLGFVLVVFVFFFSFSKATAVTVELAAMAGETFAFSVYILICAKCKADFMNFVRFGKYLAKLHNII